VKLIIGYGNELRGDDGAGPRAARTVSTWALPGVQALAVHQLTPELVVHIRAADEVLFIDAAQQTQAMSIAPLHPRDDERGWAHIAHPAALLALTEALYGCHPPATLVTIPARDFGFGAELSSLAAEGLVQALRWISGWLERTPCTKSA
jgi:hydrogenase maturation protease